MSIAFVRFLARSHNGHYFSYLSQDVLLHRYVAEGPLREGPVWASPRSRSEKDVADAKLEKTSLSADVFLGVPFVTGPSRRYLIGRYFSIFFSSRSVSAMPHLERDTPLQERLSI